MKSILILLFFTGLAQAKIGNKLLIQKDLFARGEVKDSEMARWIDSQNKNPALSSIEKDLLDQERELLREYLEIMKKTETEKESYLDEKILEIEKLCQGPYQNSQFENQYSSSRYWYRLTLNSAMDATKKKAYELIFGHLALRSQFTFEDALAHLAKISNSDLKKTYKTIMSRYIELEYNTTYRPQLPAVLSPFFIQ